MAVDHFAQFSARRQKSIDDAKLDKATGFYLPDHPWEQTVYLLHGEEVTKEVFILRSGLEHLLPGVSTVKCSQCCREDSPENWHKRCGMPQPGGRECEGVFF
jgi:hypothetical protein